MTLLVGQDSQDRRRRKTFDLRGNKKALLTPRAARDSAPLVNDNTIPAAAENGVFFITWRPWWIGILGRKLRIFYRPTPLLFGAPLPIFPVEFRGEVKRQETRVMGLLCGEGCVILTSTVCDW